MTDLLERLLAWASSLSSPASDALQLVADVDPALRIAISGAATALEMFVVTGFIAPGDAIVLLAASVVASPLEGIALGATIAVATLVGEFASLWLGRRVRTSRWAARIGARRGVAAAGRFLGRRGGPAVLAARFVPGLRTVMAFAVGASGFTTRRFLRWAVPAAIAWPAIYVPLVAAAAAPLRDGSGSALLSAGLVGIGLVVFVVASLVHRAVTTDDRADGARRPEPSATTDA